MVEWVRSAMDWTFNLRTPYYSGSDDEDDSSETEQTAVSDNSSSLLTEFDLSSRQDNAFHKPNPWTIAKINATTRKASRNKESTVGTRQYNGRKRITSPQKPTTPPASNKKSQENGKERSVAAKCAVNTIKVRRRCLSFQGFTRSSLVVRL